MTKLPTSLPSSFINPVSGSAAVPAASKSSTPEGGGFQETLNQSLKAEVAAQKGASALPTSKAQASSGTTANGSGKLSKDKERELAAAGPVLPPSLDPLVVLPVTQTPQQIFPAQGASAEGDTAGSSAEAVKQAQGLAFAGSQTLQPLDVTGTALAQNSVANQDIHAVNPLPDAASSSKQAVLAPVAASPASAFPSTALSTPASPAASSVQPAAAKDSSKQELATDAAALPISAVPSAAPANALPGLDLPNPLVSQIAAAPSFKLAGTTLNANRSSQPADGKPRQSGSALDTNSSLPGESRSTPLHTFGTALAVEPSAAAVAGANGPNSTFIPTGDAVLSAPSSSAGGHASADVSGSQTSAGLPAANAADIASQAAAPSINSAKILETIHGTELRLGLHSTEFGSISIATSVSPEGIAAQIALDHGTLGRALATHLTSMEEKLGSSFGLPAKVELRDGTASGSQGSGAGTANTNENSRGNARQQWTGREAEQSAQARGGLGGSLAATESRAAAGNGVRLSVQA